MMSWFDNDFVANDLETNPTPARDIEKKDKTYVVKADMPGLRKKDIHLQLKNGMLTVRGELHERNEERTGRHQRNERILGSFERKFRVPQGVTENDIHAQYKNGVLELTIAAPKENEPKAIEIKVE
jgi:HSP20 family protein